MDSYYLFSAIITPALVIYIAWKAFTNRTELHYISVTKEELKKAIAIADKTIAFRRKGINWDTYIVTADGMTLCCDIQKNEKFNFIENLINADDG